MAKKCSIIIPTKDKFTRLNLTLRCLECQVDENVEVIVVFDGCNEQTLKDFENASWSFQPIPVIAKENVGRAAARNLGLEIATGDVVIFLDDDRLVEPNFIKRHMAHHTGDKPVVVLGERMDSKNTEQELTEMMVRGSAKDALKQVRRTSKKEFYYNIKKWFVKNPMNSLRFIAFITGNVSIERSAVEKIKGFDNNFKGWGYEDTDLGYRLEKLGIEYVQDNKIICYHLLHAHNKASKSKEELQNLTYLKSKFPKDKILQRTLVFYTVKAKLHL